MKWDGMSRSRIDGGLQRERGVGMSLQRGVRRSLQEEKVRNLLFQNSRKRPMRYWGGETSAAALEGSTHVGTEHVRYIF